MTEKVKVQIEVERKGQVEANYGFECDLPTPASEKVDDSWIPLHLEIETRVEGILYKFEKALPDLKAVTGFSSFTASQEGWIWFELSNMLTFARSHLARARAYKGIEPAHTGSLSQANRLLYIIHDRKMSEFHHALRNIKKLEDMILRLVLEAVGGSMEGIDKSEDEWEYNLTLKNVKKGLKKLKQDAAIKNITETEFKELQDIVGRMNHKATKKMSAFWQYRHALEHRIPKTVDYPELYSWVILPANPDWKFLDLYEYTVFVYRYYLSLIERLAKLSICRHPVQKSSAK